MMDRQVLEYKPIGYDELFEGRHKIRSQYRQYVDWLLKQSVDDLEGACAKAERLFRERGITFAVYGDENAKERLIPFDVVPRIIAAKEWDKLAAGVKQRVAALNAFLHDIYHEQMILRAKIVPEEQVLSNAHYRPEMIGFTLPNKVYAHIAGIDLVRNNDGNYYVLEDNLRTPSGVSYMIENRRMMQQLFPDLCRDHQLQPVQHYPIHLHKTLQDAGRHLSDNPTIVVLTPGAYNSAYFEHAFLAREMGVPLVEGADLLVRDKQVYMQTLMGEVPVHVIYRRLDDDYLDPLAFRHDSVLGVPGLAAAYLAGNVALANALGTGVADDKSIYPYVPDMIRFYLGEEPILKNVPTWQLRNPDDLAYVLDHLPSLVVKEAQGSGGYGMLIGPAASKAEIAAYKERILAEPAAFIAQPTLSLSTCPTWIKEEVNPRHIDLRPFVLSGETANLVAGGLTRVALKEGSLVVNSSQGGGTKDTWVLA